MTQLSPTTAIVIVGGHNSVWPAYLKLARDLEDISGLRAVGVPAMIWDWRRADRRRDATNLLAKLDETVAWARVKLRADRLVLVGHSAGGLLARLYLCHKPVWGQTYSGLRHVTSLITLGSPHLADRGTDTGWYLADEANRMAAGTPHTGHICYKTVAGRCIKGHREGTLSERRAHRYYEFFVGQGDVWGDGMVPIQAAVLDGAENQTLEGVAHSRKVSRNWYGGSKAIVRRWWPHGFGEGRSDAG